MLDRIRVLLPGKSVICYGLATLSLTFGAGFWQTSLTVTLALTVLAGLLGLLAWHWRDNESRSIANLNSTKRVLVEQAQADGRALKTSVRRCDEILESLLVAAGGRIGLDADSRASIYMRGDSSWRRVARYSDHVDFRSGGRMEIPFGDCVIDRAYINQKYVARLNSAGGRTGYLAEQRRVGVSRSVAKSLRMESLSYWAISFGLPGARARDCVLVLESADEFGLDESGILAIFDEEMIRVLREVVRLRDALLARTIGRIEDGN